MPQAVKRQIAAAIAGVLWIAGATTASSTALQQTPPSTPMTAEQDRRQMMDQLGITRLIPGPSADPAAANAANYDEARANPFPDLPDLLETSNGRRVTSGDMWFDVRRPELVEVLEREVYGRVPSNAPRIDWQVAITDRQRVGFTPVTARRVVGHASDPATPGLSVNMRMTVVLPANTDKPVPVLIMFGRDDFPAPSEPTRAEMERIDAALKRVLVTADPALSNVFEAHPAFQLHQPAPFRFPERDARGDYPRPDQIIAAGWGYALLDTETIQPDDGAALTRGIIGLTNRGGPRTPDQWGALRAWAWGASRALDFLSSDPAVDARRIGIEGVSRYGKAALVAMAFDPRFAVALVGSSGKGGTTLLRRNFGESVTNLTSGAHHWMAGNFLRYGAQAGRDVRDAGDLPVDAHALIALCAPRPVFISYGIPEQGDAHWLDHRGSLMAAVAADRVYRLLGAKGLGLGDDYRNVALPPVNTGLLEGRLAWRQHDGGHTDTPNLTPFLGWADGQLATGTAAPPAHIKD